MNRMHTMWSLAAIALAAILPWSAGCHGPSGEAKQGQPKSEEVAPISVTVTPAAVRNVQRRIGLVGTLHALETVTLSPQVSGLAQKVIADEGDRVKPGDLLVEIDSTDYQLAMTETQRALERELAKIGLAKMPDGRFDIEALPSVARSRALVENAQKILDRMRKLVERNATTLQEYEDAVTKLQVEQATYRQTLLDVQATLAAARYADSLLQTAQRRLAETKLVAPEILLPGKQDARAIGYVVIKRDTSTGEMVTSAKPVYELAIDDLLKLKATVPERHAGEVALGQQVELSIDAYPKEVFKATVSRVSPSVDPESRTFAIEAIVPNSEHRLKHGAFAKASIITRAESQAVTVPLESVVSFAGVTKVFAVEGGKAHGVEIELGVQGKGWVEVIGPLQGGTQVVTNGQTQLADGTPIEIREGTQKTAALPPESK